MLLLRDLAAGLAPDAASVLAAALPLERVPDAVLVLVAVVSEAADLAGLEAAAFFLEVRFRLGFGAAGVAASGSAAGVSAVGTCGDGAAAAAGRAAGATVGAEAEAAARAALNSGIGTDLTLTNRFGKPPSARKVNITAEYNDRPSGVQTGERAGS